MGGQQVNVKALSMTFLFSQKYRCWDFCLQDELFSGAYVQESEKKSIENILSYKIDDDMTAVVIHFIQAILYIDEHRSKTGKHTYVDGPGRPEARKLAGQPKDASVVGRILPYRIIPSQLVQGNNHDSGAREEERVSPSFILYP